MEQYSLKICDHAKKYDILRLCFSPGCICIRRFDLELFCQINAILLSNVSIYYNQHTLIKEHYRTHINFEKYFMLLQTSCICLVKSRLSLKRLLFASKLIKSTYKSYP